MKIPLMINSFSVSELITKMEKAGQTGTDVIISVNNPSCYNPSTALAFHDLISKFQKSGASIKFETSGLISLNELIIMLAVRKDNRKMGPNAYLRFDASIRGFEQGTAAEQLISFENSKKLRESVISIVSANSELDKSEVKERLERQELISSSEAAALGFF